MQHGSDRRVCGSGGCIGRRRIGTAAKRVIAANRWHNIGAKEEDLETYCDDGMENEDDDRKKTCGFGFRLG